MLSKIVIFQKRFVIKRVWFLLINSFPQNTVAKTSSRSVESSNGYFGHLETLILRGVSTLSPPFHHLSLTRSSIRGALNGPSPAMEAVALAAPGSDVLERYDPPAFKALDVILFTLFAFELNRLPIRECGPLALLVEISLFA